MNTLFSTIPTHEQQQERRSLLFIVLAVLCCHTLLIGWGLIANTWVRAKPISEARRLVVQTVNLTPAPQVKAETVMAEIAEATPPQAALPEEAPAPPPPPAPKPKAPEAKPKPKPEPKKEVKPTPKPAPKPAPKPKPDPKPKPKEQPVKKEPPKPQPKAKEEDLKAAAQAKAAAEKVAAEEKALKAKQEKLLTEAQERIAKIGKTGDKGTLAKGKEVALKALPGAIATLNIDALPGNSGAALNDQERSYRDELASRLKLLLKLPEYGDVKIKLTLDRAGRVVKVVVVSANSDLNKKHIEKTLPSLSFPAFGTNFGSDKEYSFSITLTNEL